MISSFRNSIIHRWHCCSPTSLTVIMITLALHSGAFDNFQCSSSVISFHIASCTNVYSNILGLWHRLCRRDSSFGESAGISSLIFSYNKCTQITMIYTIQISIQSVIQLCANLTTKFVVLNSYSE